MNNKELPATELLTNPELTIYDYLFDIKDVNGKILICEFDRVPYSIGQKLITALLINVYDRSDKNTVDKGVIKSRNEDTDTLEILTQNGVVNKTNIKSHFVKVVPSYVVLQQKPKWVNTEAFINEYESIAILNYILSYNYTEGYMKWRLIYIDEEGKTLTIAVGNDHFSKGIAYIDRQDAMFKKGGYELDVIKYNSNFISNGKVVVKWDLDVDTSALTNLNSIQVITT
jgi:hypothetical protein